MIPDFNSDFAQVVYNWSHQRDQRWQQEVQKLQAGIAQAVADFRALKNGDIDIKDCAISDNGWEFMPPKKSKTEAA